MSETPKVVIDARGPFWEVTINAPDRRNALGRGVVEGLLDAAERVAGERAVRAVILRGAGEKAFCAGADLKERQGMDEAAVRAFVTRLNQAFAAIAGSPKVWIAALRGACLGGGLELALCADLRVAHPDVVLGLPEVRLGIVPGAGGTQRLPRLIGVAKAKELILTGRRVGAAEALRLGVVNQVAAGAIAAARALAQEICECAPISLAQAKRAVDGGWDRPLAEALAFERACYEVTIPTSDRLEGLRAFAEKRSPRYTGT